MCLQETHQINRFATDSFRGSTVVDDGERNQKGVCILIPEALELVYSCVSGLGRWAIAVVQKDNTSSDRTFIANIYAPNCHRESKTV